MIEVVQVSDDHLSQSMSLGSGDVALVVEPFTHTALARLRLQAKVFSGEPAQNERRPQLVVLLRCDVRVISADHAINRKHRKFNCRLIFAERRF